MEKPKIEFVACHLGNLKEVKEVFSYIWERQERLDIVRVLQYFVINSTVALIQNIVGALRRYQH